MTPGMLRHGRPAVPIMPLDESALQKLGESAVYTGVCDEIGLVLPTGTSLPFDSITLNAIGYRFLTRLPISSFSGDR